MFLFAALLAAPVHAEPEYSIKAGYILLFTRYVEWPSSAFATPTAPIVICVLGADPFGTVLDETMAGQESQQRPLSVRRVSDAEDAENCHVVFIATSPNGQPMSERTTQWLQLLAHHPVLIITEHLAALDRGAMLSFVSEFEGGQARIRFEASLPPMHRAGLTASSQMLIAARKVHRRRLPGDEEPQ
ncbi:YfiR family protein [Peristeroidobacter soli]|uniref:YfiR family protein n=1 Tax=Peristeroidobacter soli TaxID=2497877 RepID=UPI001300615B|nr:YfiR family protein [Peristeroidobacter soli]